MTEPGVVGPPSLVNQQEIVEKKMKKPLIIGGLILLVVLLIVALAIGVFAYFDFGSKDFSPAQYLPGDTLFYASVTSFNANDSENTWLQLQSHIHKFPLAKGVEMERLAKYMYALAESVLGGAVSLEKLPEIEGDVILAVTHIPKSDVVRSRSESIDPPGLVAFIPIKNLKDVEVVLNGMLASNGIEIEKIEDSDIYKLKHSGAGNRRQSNGRELFAVKKDDYLVLGLRKIDLDNLIDPGGGFFRGDETLSLAEDEWFQKVALETEGKNSLFWYFAREPERNAGELLKQLLPTYTAIVGGEYSEFMAGMLSVEEEGVRTSSWFPHVETISFDARPIKEGLVNILPDKLVGRWVSVYVEQADSSVLQNAFEGSNKQLTLEYLEFMMELFGVEVKNYVLPLLVGRTALMMAPRYDGEAPYLALVVDVKGEDEDLNALSSSVFNQVESNWNERIGSLMQRKLQNAQISSGLPFGTGLEVDTSGEAPKVERSIEMYEGVQINTLKMPDDSEINEGLPPIYNLLGNFVIDTVSYAVTDEKLVVSSDSQATKELVSALNGAGAPTLIENEHVQRQLGWQPDDATQFSYIYPQGFMGLVRWIFCGNGLCDNDPNDEIFAVFDLVDGFLQVTKTVGATSSIEGDLIQAESFVEFVSLTAESNRKVLRVANALDVELEEQFGELIMDYFENVMEGLLGGKVIDPKFGGARNVGSPKTDSPDSRIKSNVGQLRTLAEIYYDSNNSSYLGFDTCAEAPSVASCKGKIESAVNAIKSDLFELTEGRPTLNVNASKDKYCLSHELPTGEKVCVDATGAFQISLQTGCGVSALQCIQ